MKKIFTLLFLLFYCFTAISQTDAKVEAVYTLAQIPAPLGVYNYVVQARVINTGTTVLDNLPVVLNVTGVNVYTDSQLISIGAGDTTLVSFSPFSPWNQGNNTVNVSVPADDNNTNNSSAYPLLVNASTYSYADESPAVSSTGYGTGSGMLLTRYRVTGSGVVKQVRAFISNDIANIGNTVYGVVVNFGSIIGQSDAHLITASELGSYITLEIAAPPDVDYDFYAGLLQTANVITAYNPLGVQAEPIPTRSDAYYSCHTDGSNLTALTFFGRLMIQAVVDIGTVTPFNFTITTPNYPIAGWDLSGTTSSAQVIATTYDTLLASSNLLTRGPGAVVSPGFHSFNTTGFQNTGIDVSGTSYFQLSLSPKSGDTLSLYSISGYVHGHNSSITNPVVSSQFAYSLDGINYTLISSPFQSTANINSFVVSLAGVPALQNILSGTTVYLRYYASGEMAAAGWGFVSPGAGYKGLLINGRLVSGNTILTAPVEPTGSPFTLSQCSSTASGSVSFTSAGTFSNTNQYLVQLGEVTQPHANNFRFKYPITIGTLAGNANSGVINFTIPAGTNEGTQYAIRVVSTQPYVEGSFTQLFAVNASYCHTQPYHYFRSKASGDWNNINSWESSDGNEWIPATSIPTEAASGIEILKDHVITVTTNIVLTNTVVHGTLKLMNGNGDKGTLGFINPGFVGNIALKVDTSGIFQVLSTQSVYSDALFNMDGDLRISGKVLIGNGLDPIAAGFDQFATESPSTVRWYDGSVFEWNNNTGATPGFDTTYFPDNFSTPAFRVTNLAPGTYGNSKDLLVNGVIEVNTPVTFAGTGTKTFTGGIRGASILTQGVTCGKFITASSFEDIPATTTNVATRKGIIDGNIHINLSDAGLLLTEGATIPDSAKVFISGESVSLQKFELFGGAKLTLDPGSLLTIENADLINAGLLDGTGNVKFTGDATSLLTSPGLISAPIILVNKQLELAGNSNTGDIDLAEASNIMLNSFNLNIGSSSLTGDSANFIVTNDTGRLNRYVAATPVRYPVGVNNTSYTPVTITNSGNADNIKVRVANDIPATTPAFTQNVNRTWFIGDTTQTGCNLSFVLQWNAADENPTFNRDNAYISHLTGCGDPLNCGSGSFDQILPGMAAATGATSYSIERDGINNFISPAFIVNSRPFVYTFTGDGDWDIPANWTPAIVAPSVITQDIEVSIDPVITGQCLRNGNIKIEQGGKLTVQPGKKLTVTGSIILE